jgi:hypothetical protein
MQLTLKDFKQQKWTIEIEPSETVCSLILCIKTAMLIAMGLGPSIEGKEWSRKRMGSKSTKVNLFW